MNDLRLKLQYIYLPFLIIAFCCIAGCTFLNWFLIIKTEWIDLPDIWFDFVIPFMLPWLPLLVWLRPRVNLLILPKGKDPHGFLIVMAGIAIVLTTILTQLYLSIATGKLTQIQNAGQIHQHPATKYYNIKNLYIDKLSAGIYRVNTVTGKNNRDFEFKVYFVCGLYAHNPYNWPETKLHLIISNNKRVYIQNGRVFILSPFNDLTDKEFKSLLSFWKKSVLRSERPKAWLGIVYSKTVSNKLTDSEKKSQGQSFRDACITTFQETNLNNFRCLERMGNTFKYEEFEEAINATQHISNPNPVIFKGMDEPYEQRNGNRLPWIFGSFGIGAGIWFLFLLRGHLPPNAINRLKKKKY